MCLQCGIDHASRCEVNATQPHQQKARIGLDQPAQLSSKNCYKQASTAALTNLRSP